MRDTSLPTESEVLLEAERELRRSGRVALSQVVRTEGSTPGKPVCKLLVRIDGSACGNLGGGAFEALVERDAARKLTEIDPVAEIRRYYLTEDAVRGEATGMVCGGLLEVFMEVLTAKPLLVACGGGPVGQALARNAELCGFDTLVADDREAFSRPDLFPEETLVVTVDRDFELDFLEPHRRRDLYIAVVSRCWETDLAASGIDLKAPIGLPIGADTPGELAVSILAELIDSRSAERGEPVVEAD